MSDVTVVMATRNRRDGALDVCRRLRQLPERPPVILVDNASTDGTADAVEAEVPDVQVVRLDRNRGAVGRTVGVERASTSLVAFADDDSWWTPGALQRATEHFAASPRLGLLAARILVNADERLDPVCEEMSRSPLPRDPNLPGPSVLGFVACGSIVRREAYLQVGGFHPVVFFAGEETVLAQDLAAADWGVAYVDDVIAHHHPGEEGWRPDRRRLVTRNALLSSLLRRPAPVTVRHVARLLPTAVHDPEIRGGILDALRRSPKALASRRVLPPDVEAHVALLEGDRV